MWDGARFVFSHLFTLSGRGGSSLPLLRHFICRACFLLGATPYLWCIRGGCTVLGTGVGMNLKVVEYAVAFGRKENATFAMMMKFNTLCFI